MFFRYNQSKHYKRIMGCYKAFSAFFVSFAASILLYAISNLFVVIFDEECIIDIISLKYMSIFICFFVILFIALTLVFLNKKEGLYITENSIYITGDYIRGIPTNITIPFDSIISVECIDRFSYKETLKNYINHNYRWYVIGINMKNLEFVKIHASDKASAYDTMYLIPLDDIDGFMAEYNRTVPIC